MKGFRLRAHFFLHTLCTKVLLFIPSPIFNAVPFWPSFALVALGDVSVTRPFDSRYELQRAATVHFHFMSRVLKFAIFSVGSTPLARFATEIGSDSCGFAALLDAMC